MTILSGDGIWGLITSAAAVRYVAPVTVIEAGSSCATDDCNFVNCALVGVCSATRIALLTGEEPHQPGRYPRLQELFRWLLSIGL